MLLTSLLIGGTIASGVFGAGKGVKAAIDNSDAKDINDSAQRKIEKAKKRLKTAQNVCNSALEELGALKVSVLENSIIEFVNTIEQIKEVEYTECNGLIEIKTDDEFLNQYENMKELGGIAVALKKGIISGTAGGALTAFGAFETAKAIGAASTGVAIKTLSGIAAKNATLAFLGGGTLASGGFGIAGGTAVLGGLIAGPALLVTGFIIGSKASANLDNAYSNMAKAKTIEAELDSGGAECYNIVKRVNFVYTILARLDAYLMPLIFQMKKIVDEEGTDYRAYSDNSKKIIASTVSMAVSVKAILNTPILTEEGKLSEESLTMGNSGYEFLLASEK